MNNIQLIIQHESIIYSPPIVEGITWQTERKGSPGKLEFKILWKEYRLYDGDIVRFTQNNDDIFYGYIFKLSNGKDGVVTVTCYDQLRYFKNKDTYVYEGKTADEVIKMLCRDFGLKTGTIERTGYKIPSRIEENKSLFEISQNALDLTLQNVKKMYVLYDDFGKLTLKNITSMGKAQLLIDNETAENYDYKSSIDDDTYNRVKLTYDNKDTGKREVYTAQSNSNIKKWGVLQYFGTLNKDENGKTKAESLLSLYNTENKTLSVKNAFGINSVRAGSLVLVNLKLGNTTVAGHLMTVEKCKHEYKHRQHFMSLELSGGGFSA